MKIVKEPTYKKDIVDSLERFDERQNGFSRGRVDPSGSKYDRMHDRSVENIHRKVPGKTVLDHALWVSARTVDYVLRQTQMAREGTALFNQNVKLESANPGEMSRIIKRVARWLGADRVGIAEVNPLWVYTHWGHHSAHYCGGAQGGDPVEIQREYRYAIVLIHEMDYDLIKRTPAVEPSTDLAYSRMGEVACSLATFVREIGYIARAFIKRVKNQQTVWI